MILLIGLITCLCPAVRAAEQDEHRDFQYNSVVDAQSGRYNFAYDTGNDNEIAHSLHMQYRGADGIVRGRYGYTDPRGKLRMVEYEAGPDGFKARGDVGPDQAPHDQSPDLGPPAPQQYSAAYRQATGEDLELIPSPVQMAGWDPLTDPMGTNRPPYSGVYEPPSESLPGRPESEEQSDYSTRNLTSGDDSTSYGTETDAYDDRYPRIIFSSSVADRGSEAESVNYLMTSNESHSENVNEAPLNNSKPDDINASANSSRSADEDLVQTSSNEHYSYHKYLGKTHDHSADPVNVTDQQQTNDQDSDRPTRTHDHEAEMRRHRINHDHSGEIYHQRHDHEAERAYYYWRYRNPAYYYWRDGRPVYTHTNATHDHDAERDHYHGHYYPDGYNEPRKIFYKDSHSQIPHEHNEPPIDHNGRYYYYYPDRYGGNRVYHDGHYHNRESYDRNRVYHNGHYHSRDGSGRNPMYHNGHYHYPDQAGNYDFNDYPATVRPRQLKYIPADKYHDKYYYWTDDK